MSIDLKFKMAEFELDRVIAQSCLIAVTDLWIMCRFAEYDFVDQLED